MEIALWEQTVERWKAEGLPESAASADLLAGNAHFGLEGYDSVLINTTFPEPCPPEFVVSEDDRYITFVDGMGRTRVALKSGTVRGMRLSMDSYVAFPLRSREDWPRLRALYEANPLARLPAHWPSVAARLCASSRPTTFFDRYFATFGCYSMMRNWMGTEGFPTCCTTTPTWCASAWTSWSTCSAASCRGRCADVGFDLYYIHEDMAGSQAPLVSPELFRAIFLPPYRRLVDLLKKGGVKNVIVDTDGCFGPLIPVFLDAGVDGFGPIERAAGMDPRELRARYGKSFSMIGGIDKRVLKKPRADMEKEIMESPAPAARAGRLHPHHRPLHSSRHQPCAVRGLPRGQAQGGVRQGVSPRRDGAPAMSTALPFLALDIGAASGRAMLAFPNDGPLELREVHRFANGPVPLAGVLYWDFLRIWENILEALCRCAAAGHAELAGIGVDTWNVDFGLVDDRGGLVRNPVSYRSPQSEEAMREIRGTIDEQELYRITGFGYSRITALPRLLELRRELGPAFLGGVRMLPLPDLIRHFLCGGPGVEETILWGTQLADIRARAVSARLLQAFSLPASILPPVIRGGEARADILPAIGSATGVERASVYAVAGHDTMSAATAGAALCAAGDGDCAVLCTGSWFILGRLLGSPLTDPACLRRGFVNEIAPLGLTFLARNMMGFFLLEELLRHWRIAEPGLSWTGLFAEAEASPPFTACVDSNDPSFFSSTNAARSLEEYLSRTGQAASPGRGAVARAVLEGLVLSSRSALGDLEALTGSRVGRVVVVGGGARNALLCRMLADCLERPVAVGPAEATVLGNIGMQMAGAGLVTGAAELQARLARGFPSAVHEPAGTASWRTRAERSP